MGEVLFTLFYLYPRVFRTVPESGISNHSAICIISVRPVQGVQDNSVNMNIRIIRQCEATGWNFPGIPLSQL